MSEANEVPFFQHPSSHKDPRKPGDIVTLEIECAVANCVLPSGQVISEGLNRVDVREDFVERINALVADAEPCEGGVRTNPTKIEEAKARVEEAKRIFAEGKTDADGKPIPWKYLQHHYDGPRHWVNEYVARNFPSVGGIYKSVLPLRSAVRVGDPKPQPPTDAERIAQNQLSHQSQAMSEAIAAALAKHLGTPNESGDTPRRKRRDSNT